MSLSNWAKNEIKIASVGKDEYTKGVINSASKAFLTLLEDGHSGMSIGFTKNILDRLIACKPLTDLTGNDDEWSDVGDYEDCRSVVNYQNKRCSSVFKKIHPNGDITYSDVDRFVCEDINSGATFYSGGITRAVEHYFPVVQMPYYPPSKRIVIFTEDFLVDAANGDFDTRGIFYAVHPNGDKQELNIFQAEKNGEFVNITKDEYIERRAMRLKGDDSDMKHSYEKGFDELQEQVFSLNDPGKLSDGFHTYDELYYHRMRLFSVVCNTYKPVAWKSMKHSDGTMYEGMFIVGVSLENGDFSYHYDMKHWKEFDVPELETAPEWDGHTAKDVDRLKILTD